MRIIPLILMLWSSCCIAQYNRSLFGNGWIDIDNDCQDTRQEVLIRDSLIAVTYKDSKQCNVSSGLWICPYTGKAITNPSDIDIDHMIPLKVAYDSGARFWTQSKRILYANNLQFPYMLVASYNKANRSKGDRSPQFWMPPNTFYWNEYLSNWILIKSQWELSTSEDEMLYINKLLALSISTQKGIKVRTSHKQIWFE